MVSVYRDPLKKVNIDDQVKHDYIAPFLPLVAFCPLAWRQQAGLKAQQPYLH
jgi:hypothetical protein